MGTICSLNRKTSVIGCGDDNRGSKNTMDNNTRYNISASIVCNNIWNPFRISQQDAETLLQDSYQGAFIFSHNVSSEIFLSVSTGKYVCHHPISKHGQHFEIGGRNFSNVKEAILFHRLNPLGDVVLTEQFYSMREKDTETNQSHGSTSPKITKSKHVTFDMPKIKVKKTVSIISQPSMIIDERGPTTTNITVCEELSCQRSEELLKKILNKPRKSICRIQPAESLSTSSENMFKEEQF